MYSEFRVRKLKPRLVSAQLEAEALKRGLFTTPVQAGSQASVLANVTSGWGMNVMGNHMLNEISESLSIDTERHVTPEGGGSSGWISARHMKKQQIEPIEETLIPEGSNLGASPTA